MTSSRDEFAVQLGETASKLTDSETKLATVSAALTELTTIANAHVEKIENLETNLADQIAKRELLESKAIESNLKVEELCSQIATQTENIDHLEQENSGLRDEVHIFIINQ